MNEETIIVDDPVIEPEIVEPETVEPEVEPEAEPEEEKVPKGVQKRIDAITREKYEERRARERADAELALMRRELEQLKTRPAEPAKTLPNGAPDPEKYPAGRYDPDYLEAVTDYKVQQRFEQQQAQTRAAQKSQSIAAMEAEVAKTHTDYAQATQELLQHPIVNVPQFRDILADADNPAELAYYLGKNPEELDVISNLTPTQAIRYMGKLEAKISNTTAEPAKAVTAAPKPIAPLGSAKSTGANKSPENMTQTEYVKWRESQKK